MGERNRRTHAEPGRRCVLAAALGVAAALACGCATVPTGGPVVAQKIAQAGGPQAGTYEQLIAPPPEGPDSPAAQPGPRIMHGPGAACASGLRGP